MYITTAVTGDYEMGLPAWGRNFWQDPNDGQLFLAFASGNQEVDYIYSSDSGVTWSSPQLLFAVDNFSTFNNFDIFMDYQGHLHAGFALNGSGCYQHFGKKEDKTGWTSASGAGVKPLNNYWPTGRAKGWNGTISRLEAAPFWTLYPSFPRIIIGSKNSHGKVQIHSVPKPFNGNMELDFTAQDELGDEGGWPILLNDLADKDPACMAISGANTIRYLDHSGWSKNGSFYTDNGFRLYKDSLCYGSGSSPGMSSIVLNSSPSGAELWGVSESFSAYSWAPALSGYLPENAGWRGEFRNDVYNATTSGNNVDFSFNDQRGVHILYFQDIDSYGSVCIKRLLNSYVKAPSVVVDTRWEFSPLNHSVSGVKEVAVVDKNTAGGINYVGYWKKFKAIKHPVAAGIRPNPLVHKGEFLVTHSHPPLSTSGNYLNIFNVAEAQDVVPNNFVLPNVYRDYTQDLTTVIASGSITNVTSIFQQNNAFGTLSAAGGFLTLEFPHPVHINKIHFAKEFLRSWGTLSVSGSLDNVDWKRISGQVNSITSEQIGYISSNDRDTGAFGWINSPVCKYLKLQFSGSQSTKLYNIRVYGKGNIRRNEMSLASFANYSFVDREIRKERSRSTERFVYQHDTIPPGFDVYGNIGWKVKASGAFAATNFLPGAPAMPNGQIPSGTYAGDSYGRGDGFSVQNDITSSAGATGVLQYRVYIDEPRRISFYKKADLHPNDKFEFYVVSPGGPGSGVRWTSSEGTSHDWTSVSTSPLSVGNHLLKWIYTRGATTTSGVYGAAWIDDVVGLDVPQPSMYGWTRGGAHQISGSIHSYLSGGAQSFIHAFISGAPLTSYINAYMPSAAFIDVSSSIDAYMKGNGVQINGYMLGSDGAILSTIPTGTIHAVMGVGAGNSSSSILSFLAGTHANFIHGYLRAADDASTLTPSGDFSINAYMLANKPFEAIHAILNAPSGTPSQSIHSYAKGDIGDQTIHAYLMSPEGGNGPINAYTEGWDGSPGYFNNGPQSMVYAYMAGPISSGTASIHTYMLAKLPNESINAYMGPSVAGGGAVAGGPGGFGGSTSGVEEGQNWIDSYLKGYDGAQKIHAYIMGPEGGLGSIHSYLLGGKNDNRIWGYLPVYDNTVSQVNAYASGIGFGSQASHAYMFGASGLITSAIHSLLTGHEDVSAVIWGVIQGRPEDGDCLFFGLVPENPGTIPDGTSPGMFI